MQFNEMEENYRADRPWQMLLKLYWPERRSLVIGEVAYLLKASPVWVMPLVTANIIDIVAQKRAGGVHLILINAAVGALFIAQNIPTGILFARFSSRAIRNVENRLRSALVRRLQMLSIGYYDKISAGRLQTKVLRDVESVEQLSRQLSDPVIAALVGILVALGVTACRMPSFLPVLLLLAPLVAMIRFTMSKRLRRYNESFRKALESMSEHVAGMIAMIPVTRAHAAEEEEIARAEDRFGHVRETGQRFDRQATLFGATAWVTFMMFNLGCLAMAAVLSYRGTLALTPGDIILLSGYLTTVTGSVMQLNAMLPIFARGFDALRSIGEVLESPDIEENRGKQKVERVEGAVEFKNVSFEFEDKASGKSALRGINLSVARGETIGIVGASGSGKTTLMSLVIGFHRPTQGQVLLDGVDMREIDLRSYRRWIAVVSQQTLLFRGTVRENIIYGTSHVTPQQLEEALEVAGATEFVKELPDGLETNLGEGGARLSGGQRQRLAIARAALRNARVLILDEPTSALDRESEARVQQALERLRIGRTTFIVAHRVHTLAKVDRIITLERGAIAKIESPPTLIPQESFQTEASIG